MTTENVITQFNKYLSENSIEGKEATVKAAYAVLKQGEPANANGVSWWVNNFGENFVADFVSQIDAGVAIKWATDYEAGTWTEPKSVGEISDLFAAHLTEQGITDHVNMVEAAYKFLAGGASPKNPGGIKWWADKGLDAKELATQFLEQSNYLEEAREWANDFESGVPGEPGEPSSLTEALEALQAANAGVADVLAEAATAVNAAEEKEDQLEGEELKQFISEYNIDDLKADLKESQDAVAGLEAAVDAANAALLTAGAVKFVEGSAGSQVVGGVDTGDVVKDAITALTAGGDDALVSADAYLTKANIEKAVADAQAAVNADKLYIVATATEGAITVKDQVYKLVGIVVDVAGDATAAGDEKSATHYAIQNGVNFYDAAGQEIKNGGATAIALNSKDIVSAKQLQAQAIAAAGQVTSDISTNGTNVDLLVELREAIGELVKAGVAPDAGVKADGQVVNLQAVLTAITTALGDAAIDATLEAMDAAVVAALADAIVEGKSALETGDKALDKALNSIVDKINSRDSKESAAKAAKEAFEATDSGELLGHANVLLDAREALEEAVAEAEQAMADNGTLAETLEALLADHKAAEDAVKEAEKYFTEEGLELPERIDGETFVATEESDIVLFDVTIEGNEATILGFESDDILFVGKGFTVNVLEAGVDLANERVGDASVREVFIQQVGNNTVLSFEQEDFAGNQKTGSLTDIVQVTLTGVDAADVSLDADGYISIA